MANTSLDTLVSNLLTDAETVLTANGITLPDRRYHHSGQIAEDCPDQLVVSAISMGEGLGGDAFGDSLGPPRCAFPPFVDIAIRLTRCVPHLDDTSTALPTEAELNTSATELLTDAWVLYTGLISRFLDGNLSANGACDELSVLSMDAVGPSGDTGGWELRLRLQLNPATSLGP